jgi:hypothetical protein
MKVKIKKKGKQKTYNLIDSWSDVSLEKWIELINIETASKTKEAEETIAAFSDIPQKLVKELSLRDVAIIMEKIAELQVEQSTLLRKVIEIDGVEYGMHPNLDSITLGEYADIETLIKEGLEQNMPELTAVLFRPVTERNGEVYTIEAYDGEIAIRAEQMKKMSAEQVQSCLVFFWHFVNGLSKIFPLYLIQAAQERKTQLQTGILPNAGAGSE